MLGTRRGASADMNAAAATTEVPDTCISRQNICVRCPSIAVCTGRPRHKYALPNVQQHILELPPYLKHDQCILKYIFAANCHAFIIH